MQRESHRSFPATPPSLAAQLKLSPSVNVTYILPSKPGIRVGTRVVLAAGATAKAQQQFKDKVLPAVGSKVRTALAKYGTAGNTGAKNVRNGSKLVTVPRRRPPPCAAKRPPPPKRKQGL